LIPAWSGPTSEMTEAIICPKCKAPNPVRGTGFVMMDCIKCTKPFEAQVWPRLVSGADAGAVPDAVLSDEHSACFNHPEKQATAVCDGCGRFICTLCDIEVEGKHLCSGCFESGRTKGE